MLVRFPIHSRHALAALSVLALALIAPACKDEHDAASKRLNVLLIVIDTARADKLGCYGHPGGLTPHIDALAREGVRCERAAAHAPWTLPSTASLLTSLHPQEHGAGGYLDLSAMAEGAAPKVSFRGLPESVETVIETFHNGGWRTGAIVNVDFLDKEFGLTQGVEDLDAAWYASNEEVRSATQTTDLALEWMKERGEQPFILLAHYFDAHAIYSPPDAFRQRFAAPEDREHSSFVFGTRQHMLLLRSGKLQLETPMIERAERLYEAELAYVDAEVGRLLAGLEERGLAEDTLVVLTADHGEEFLDHGGFEHGHTLYDELTSVPLILRLPEHLPAGTTLQGTAALVDVAPTLCELAGLEAPRMFVGHSLLANLRDGTPLSNRPVLAHGNFWGEPLVSWQSGPWKLILSSQGAGNERIELYDMKSDPREQRDVSLAERETVTRLQEEYAAVRAHLAAHASGAPLELSAEMLQRLKDLGYAGAADENTSGAPPNDNSEPGTRN